MENDLIRYGNWIIDNNNTIIKKARLLLNREIKHKKHYCLRCKQKVDTVIKPYWSKQDSNYRLCIDCYNIIKKKRAQ